MKHVIRTYLYTFIRPSRAFEALSEDADVRAAVGAMVLAGLAYGAFVLWMYLAGHEPSFTGNPIPASEYYLWQAGFLVPWLLVAWCAASTVAFGLARAAGSSASWRQTVAPLGFALAVPLTWGYVLPEMLVFGFFGHDALVAAMRVTGPCTLVWWGFTTWKALRATYDHSWIAAAAIALATLLTFGAVTAALVR